MESKKEVMSIIKALKKCAGETAGHLMNLALVKLPQGKTPTGIPEGLFSDGVNLHGAHVSKRHNWIVEQIRLA